MAESLRDQLVKAGLATGAQARKAERQQRAETLAKQRHKAKHQKGGKASADVAESETDNSKARARQRQAEKTARDKALARQHNDKYAAKALRAEIKQIILNNDQRITKVPEDDAVPYNFVHGKRIKKLYVTKAQQEALSEGRLLIINNDGNYHFLLPQIAAKIEARDPKRIIVAHDKTGSDAKEKSADDEYYARFEIPDDLDW